MTTMPVTIRDERGFTLIEVLIAAVMMLIILGASMTLLIVVGANSRLTEQHNDAQDRARVYTDRLARQLRNLASPSLFTADYYAKPEAVDKAQPYDFVFRVVDEKRPAGSLNEANVKRVRYCLDSTNPDNGALYQQEQKWTNAASSAPPALPSTAACPGTGAGWTSTTQVTNGLVNRIDGQNRPLFTYNATDVTRITQVRSELFVDPTPHKRPVESRLASGVTLRNQNRVPVALADVRVTDTVGHKAVLNGSGSDDPEGMPLNYQWYVDPPVPLPDCSATPKPVSCVAEGVVADIQLSTGGKHTIVLLVKDPAGLPATDSVEASF
jgi:prepilin-type N-terminal cleavage/methylation domain-containing protein